jgi:hypothetical protein
MRTARLMAVVPVVAAVLFAAGARGDDDPKGEGEYGLAVGKNMPVHVVAFVNGKHRGHGGCPAVMISNSRGRGVIVWARGAADPAFRLARGLDAAAADGDKLLRFLVAFDADDAALAKKSEGLARVVVGKPRHSAKEELDRHGVAAKTAVLVFLLDKKAIKATWSFTADELTDDRVKELVAATKKFATGD